MRSNVFSLYQFLAVQKDSQSLVTKPTVESNGEGVFAIRATMIKKNIVAGIRGGGRRRSRSRERLCHFGLRMIAGMMKIIIRK